MNTLTLTTVLALQAANPFAGDTRLDGAISYRSDVAPLRVVVAELKTLTGVELRAAPVIAEDLLVIRVKDKPSSEALTRIAKHFDWEWSKSGEGYTLGPRPGWEGRERSQIEEAIYQLMLPAVEEARSRLRDRQSGTDAEVTAKISRLKRELAELYEKGDEEDEKLWAQVARLESQLEALLSLRSPESEFALSLIASLDRNGLINLAQNSRIVYSLFPTAAQRTLPQPAVASAHKLVRDLIISRLEAESVAAGDQRERTYRDDLAHNTKFSVEDVYTVRVSVEARPERMIRRGGWAPRVEMAIVGKNGRILWSGAEYISGASDHPYGVTLRGIDGEVAGAPNEAPPRPPRGPTDVLRDKIAIEGELAEGLAGSAALAEGPTPEFIAFLTRGSVVDPLISLTRVGPLTAEAASVSYIADAYDVQIMSGAPAAGDSAGAIFESLAEASKSKWSYEGGWVAMRNESPALARAATLPRPLLFRYRDLAADQHGLTVDQTAKFASDLTDLQFASGVVELLFALLGTFDSMDVTTAYALRAWAAMTPMEKAAAKGDGVAFGRLSPAVRSNLSTFLYRSGDSWTDRSLTDLLDMLELGDEDDLEEVVGDIEKALEPPKDDGVIGYEDREITQILPNGPSTDALVRVAGQSVSAVSVKVQFGEVKFPWTLPVQMVAMMKLMADGDMGGFSDGPAISFAGYRPAIGDSVYFGIEFLPEKKASVLFLGMTAAPGTEFGPFESLPQSTRSEIDRLVERAKKMFGRFAQPPPPPAK